MMLVIGVGNCDRGDDAVGPLVARAIAATRPAAVHVVELGGDPLAVLELWCGAPVAVAIDAIIGTGRPGRIVRLEPLDADRDAFVAETFASSHALGLASAIELGRALDRVPRRLVVYGVEGVCFRAGTAPSPAVAAVVPRVLDRVFAELSGQRD